MTQKGPNKMITHQETGDFFNLLRSWENNLHFDVTGGEAKKRIKTRNLKVFVTMQVIFLFRIGCRVSRIQAQNGPNGGNPKKLGIWGVLLSKWEFLKRGWPGAPNSAATGCLSNFCSSVLARCSSVLARCSSVLARCSSVLARCSSVTARGSSVLARCSSVLARCSSVLARCSSVTVLSVEHAKAQSLEAGAARTDSS